MSPSKIVVAVDPGTSSTSPTGLVVFDRLTLEIFYCDNLTARKRELHHRIQDISNQFSDIIAAVDQTYPSADILFCVESFVMKGKGGESLQRLIGSFLGRLPERFKVKHVQNTTIKKVIAGHGHAEKEEVAAGVLACFTSNKTSKQVIERLINAGEPDILDAFAIGLTGMVYADT